MFVKSAAIALLLVAVVVACVIAVLFLFWSGNVAP